MRPKSTDEQRQVTDTGQESEEPYLAEWSITRRGVGVLNWHLQTRPRPTEFGGSVALHLVKYGW
jgi:hypothetical protein